MHSQVLWFTPNNTVSNFWPQYVTWMLEVPYILCAKYFLKPCQIIVSATSANIGWLSCLWTPSCVKSINSYRVSYPQRECKKKRRVSFFAFFFFLISKDNLKKHTCSSTSIPLWTEQERKHSKRVSQKREMKRSKVQISNRIDIYTHICLHVCVYIYTYTFIFVLKCQSDNTDSI